MDGAGSSFGGERVTDVPRTIDYIDYVNTRRELFVPDPPVRGICNCHMTHSYPNLVVNQVVKERDDLLHDHVSQMDGARQEIWYLEGSLDLAQAETKRAQAETDRAKVEADRANAKLEHERSEHRKTLRELGQAQHDVRRVFADGERIAYQLEQARERLQEIGDMEARPQRSEQSVNQSVDQLVPGGPIVAQAAPVGPNVDQVEPAGPSYRTDDWVSSAVQEEEDPTENSSRQDSSRTPSGPL